MTTQLEHRIGTPLNFITTLSRFPASKVDESLLAVIHSAMDGVVIVDSTRRIVLVNQKIERMFGYPAKQLLEKPLDVLMPSRFDKEQRKRMERLAANCSTGRRSKVELKGMRSNGEQLALFASVTRVSVHGESFLALILRDARSRGSSDQGNYLPSRPLDLRKWAASSQQANEIEKRRFSKKLYDDIGQRLSVLKLDLDWLENSLPQTDKGLPARLAEMQGLLDNVITMTKSMASALRPPLLDDFGLLAAVEWMAEKFRKKTSISCTIESAGMNGKLHDLVESAVFRVVQEGLLNIEQHSHASNACIKLKLTGGQLDVMILDDGIGMDSGSEIKTGCYGLIAMQERIFVLGGTIAIQNVKPRGLMIRVSIPIDPILITDQISHPPTRDL